MLLRLLKSVVAQSTLLLVGENIYYATESDK